VVEEESYPHKRQTPPGRLSRIPWPDLIGPLGDAFVTGVAIRREHS
jgi:hypothetical protein